MGRKMPKVGNSSGNVFQKSLTCFKSSFQFSSDVAKTKIPFKTHYCADLKSMMTLFLWQWPRNLKSCREMLYLSVTIWSEDVNSLGVWHCDHMIWRLEVTVRQCGLTISWFGSAWCMVIWPYEPSVWRHMVDGSVTILSKDFKALALRQCYHMKWRVEGTWWMEAWPSEPKVWRHLLHGNVVIQSESL
jgi:hypothetical protein